MRSTPGRALAVRSLHVRLHLQAALAHALEERVHTRQAGLRRQLATVAVASEHAEQPAHLGEGVAARLLDDRERLTGARPRLPLTSTRHRLRLDDHRAQPVRDDRLELGGDPAALVLDGPRARCSRSASARSAFSRSSR